MLAQENGERTTKVLLQLRLDGVQSRAVHLQALVSADGILPGISSKLQLLFINLASVQADIWSIPPSAAILRRWQQFLENAARHYEIMIKSIIILFLLACCSIEQVHGQNPRGPDTVSVQSGKFTLTGLLWSPSGVGPFPALILSHGNYASQNNPGTIDSLFGPISLTSLLGPVFAENGYIFFVLFRNGVGLSKEQGKSSQDQILRIQKEKNLEERNKLQIHLLETEQLEEMISGIIFLRARRDVDTNRVAIIGHSFGGSLALLLAQHDPRLKAVVDFSGGAASWNRSPQLRARLTEAVKHITAPVLFIHAKNDYSTAPADSLSVVMDRLKKPHSVIIYPPFGNNSDVGHNFIFLGIEIWKQDVLKFLNEYLHPDK